MMPLHCLVMGSDPPHCNGNSEVVQIEIIILLGSCQFLQVFNYAKQLLGGLAGAIAFDKLVWQLNSPHHW